MKTQTFQFQKMSSDYSDKMIPEGVYRKMINCRPNNKNAKGIGSVTNIHSSVKVTSLDYGQTAQYMGGCLDSKRDTIIAFWKGQYNQFITGFNTKTKTEFFILKTSVPFNNRVTSAGCIDDFLFWINDGKPRKLNLVKAIANPTLNYFSADELLIDKFPPLYPPTCTAKPDSAFQGNNISNTIFQFAFAYEYEDGEISSYSPFSKSVLPISTNGLDIVFPNNAIDVVVKSGSARVKKIHLAYRKGEQRDWLLAKVIDKAKLVIGNNINYTYTFYNDKYVSGLSQTDVITYTANPYYHIETQAIANDNFVIYGGVKDGLEKPTNISLVLDWTPKRESAPNATITKKKSYKWGATHEFGVVFRDENGRTDGVNAITKISIPFLTDNTSTKLNDFFLSAPPPVEGYSNVIYIDISWTVTGNAPSWAKTMSLVYLGNKTVSSFVDYNLTNIEDRGVYSYLDVSSLNILRKTQSVINPQKLNTNISPYTFTKGDRIRFITNKSGELLSGTFDYEVLGFAPEVVDSAGGVRDKETIFINKIGWDALLLGKGSEFELYTPKKEFADEIFYELAEVIACDDENISTTTGILSDGDVYTSLRDMPLGDIGELIAGTRHDSNAIGGNFGVLFDLSVVKRAEGVTGVFGRGVGDGSQPYVFYKNLSSEPRIINVVGVYDFYITNTNPGNLRITHLSVLNAVIEQRIIQEFGSMEEGSVSTRLSGSIVETFTLTAGQSLFLSMSVGSPLYIVTILPSVVLDLSVDIRDGNSNYSRLIESKDYSDYFESNEHSLGRPYVEIPDEDLTIKNQIVYTGKYFADTQIDQTNKINPIDVKYVPYQHGSITAMVVRGDTLKVFSPAKEFSFYLGREQALDGDGKLTQVFTSNTIGSMNVYDSDYGTENPESMLVTNTGIYYFDLKNASLVKTNQSGQADLSLLGEKTFFRQVTALLKQATNKSVYLIYNDKNQEVIVCFVYDGVSQTIVYNEAGYFTHHLELIGISDSTIEGGLALGELTLVYNNSSSHILEEGEGYNSFLEVSRIPSIEFVCNQEPKTSKIFQSMSYQGVGKWAVEVETPVSEEYPVGQYTKIMPTRFVNKENKLTSDIPFNIRKKDGTISLLGYANGSAIRNQTVSVKLTNSDSTSVRLDLVDINYIGSAIE
jgi:hypothetical protein